MRTRLLVSLLAAGALLVGAPIASAASFVSHFKAPNHTPKAGKDWPVTVTATSKSGKKLHATALYEIVEPVTGYVCKEGPDPGHPSKSATCASGPRGSKPWSFVGVMHDNTFIWPSRSLGINLILKTVVTVKGMGTVTHSWKVRVHR
jgi:hypothetical protein